MEWVIADMGLYSCLIRGITETAYYHCVADPDPGNFAASLSPMSPNIVMHGLNHVVRCLPSLTSEQAGAVGQPWGAGWGGEDEVLLDTSRVDQPRRSRTHQIPAGSHSGR